MEGQQSYRLIECGCCVGTLAIVAMLFFWALLSTRPPNVKELKAKGNVKGLIKALGWRKNPGVRLSAAEALGQIGDARAATPLYAALKDQDRQVRNAAIRALGKVGDAQAVGPLIAVLKDESESELRENAVGALGEIGDAAVEPLTAALRDKEERVRWAAVQALKRIGSARAVESLCTALKVEDAEVRLRAAQFLGGISEPRIVEALVAALSDENPRVHDVVITALVKIDDSHVAELLITALKDAHPRVRQGAASVLVQIGEPAEELLIEAMEDKHITVRVEAAKILIKMGSGKAAARLIQYLKSEEGDSHWEEWASAFAEIGKRQDGFGPVYQELQRRLDISKLRGARRRLYCGRNVDDVIAKLRRVVPRLSVLTKPQVIVAHRRTRWGNTHIESGTLDELLDLLESRLVGCLKNRHFSDFELTRCGGELNLIFWSDEGYFTDCFVWRTDKELLFCGHL